MLPKLAEIAEAEAAIAAYFAAPTVAIVAPVQAKQVPVAPRAIAPWQYQEAGPNRGVLTFTSKKLSTVYLVTEFLAEGGRGFKLDKLTPGTDPEADSYSVFLSQDQEHDTCECKGFLRWSHLHACRHVEACRDITDRTVQQPRPTKAATNTKSILRAFDPTSLPTPRMCTRCRKQSVQNGGYLCERCDFC